MECHCFLSSIVNTTFLVLEVKITRSVPNHNSEQHKQTHVYRSTYKIHNSLLPVPCFWAIVRLQTSYVPSDTTQRFMMVVSLISGFQSSRLVSKSSAKRRQSPIKRPLLTKEPELQAEMLVLSSVMTTAPRLSTSHI